MQNLLDVSYVQSKIDYQKVKDSGKADGVIIRCGRTLWGNFEPGADGCWEAHYRGFKDAGLPVGAYYYGAAVNAEQARKEAETCISLLAGKQLEYPIYYDVEEQNTQGSLTKAQLTEVVETFCKTVEDSGYFTGFYTMLGWALNKLDYPSLAKQFTSWIAWTDGDPSTRLNPAPAIWQYTWKGQIPGINGGVDLDYCYQDFPTLIKGAGLNGYGEQPSSQPTSIGWDELKDLLKGQGIETITL